LLAEIIENSLNKDIENKEDTELINQYEGFKSILIDTISTKDFADLYAQTIAYGMFAARINYTTPAPFKGGEQTPSLLERGRGRGFTAFKFLTLQQSQVHFLPKLWNRFTAILPAKERK